MDNKREESLINETKNYINKSFNYLKLDLLEKTSRLYSFLVMILICTILSLVAFIYFSTAIVVALRPLFNDNVIPGLLIIGGFFIILVVLVIVLKKKIILNPIIKQMSKILFQNNDNEITDDDEQE